MRTLIKGFVYAIILWLAVYGLVNYVNLPGQYHDYLIKLLALPGQVIIFLINLLQQKVNISIYQPSWFFIQPISWGIVGALVAFALRIIEF